MKFSATSVALAAFLTVASATKTTTVPVVNATVTSTGIATATVTSTTVIPVVTSITVGIPTVITTTVTTPSPTKVPGTNSGQSLTSTSAKVLLAIGGGAAAMAHLF